MELQDATAVILCGGKSSRMGFNKALLQINDRYVVAERGRQLQQIFPAVVLMTDRREHFFEKPAFTELTIWEDSYPECGPLGGIASALEKVATPYVFVTACDMPGLSVAAISRLAQAAQKPQVLLYRSEDHLETLFGFYHRSCLPLFKRQLQQGNRQIRQQFSQLQVTTVATTAQLFTNVNTPDELIYWKKTEGML